MYKKSLFLSLSQLFFVSLYRRRTMIIYVSKHKIFRSHGARDTLLPQHQAAVSLAETTRTSRLRPGIGAPVAAEAEVVPPRRGRQDLWVPRPPLTASSALRLFPFLLPPSSKNIKTFYHSFGQPKLPVFSCFSRELGFLPINPDFQLYKLRLSSLETFGFHWRISKKYFDLLYCKYILQCFW